MLLSTALPSATFPARRTLGRCSRRRWGEGADYALVIYSGSSPKARGGLLSRNGKRP
jgi:hypothetical protein